MKQRTKETKEQLKKGINTNDRAEEITK